MKKYILAKDIGTFEKGSEFIEFENSLGKFYRVTSKFLGALILSVREISAYARDGYVELIEYDEPSKQFYTAGDMIAFAEFALREDTYSKTFNNLLQQYTELRDDRARTD